MSDEARQLRIDIIGARDELRTLQGLTQTVAPREMLVQTTTKGTYPTTPNAYYACNPCTIKSDTPTEGGTATVAPVSPARIVYVWNAGSQVPPVGTIRIATHTGGRWVFLYC